MFEKLTQFDLHHRISENNTATLIYFSTSSCASCRHLKAVLAQLHAQRPDWLIYEVDAQTDMALTQEFEVFHLPSLFLFFNGQFHQEIQAEARVSSIISAIDTALNEPAHEAP